MANRCEHICENCGERCHRDEVDVGVGTIYGPWGCWHCGWSEDPRYDSSVGTSPAQQEFGEEFEVDPLGGLQRRIRR